MLKRVKNYILQFFSFVLVVYGFYLFFLFLYDTTLRLNRQVALPFSLMVVLLLFALTMVYWVKKKRLPL
ncbi:MAG: hypothetical protein D6699_06750 [Aquificota bacterium]|nr:MAG: hypothetical protein D6699_06750 [Aquificota bacterium]